MMAKDKNMTLLLQPVQDNPNNYKNVEELVQKYLHTIKNT